MSVGSQTSSKVTAPKDWRETLARFGLTGKGVVHVIVGFLALQLAFGSDSTTEAASQSGAIAWVGELPAGTALLWLLGLSLVCLGIWRAITAIFGDPVEDDDAPHRIAFGAKAIFYGALGFSAVRAAIDGGSSSGSGGSTEQAAGTIAGLPGGRWILFAIGLAVIGFAGYLAYTHAVKREFLERLDVGERGRAATLGRIGYGLRSLAYAMVGFLFFQAGLTGDQEKAKGLAGTLAETADASWGTVFLLLVALGFASYGVYCLFEAKHRVTA